MDWSKCEVVETVRGRVGGVPLLRHTRVPADLVAESLADGEGIDNVVYNYDLERADVQQLMAFLAGSQHAPAG